MKVSIVIPARLGSTRLPRKLMLDLGGKAVLRHTWERASKVKRANEVIVVADSTEICEAVKSWGGRAILTSPECSSGTERIGSVMDQIVGDFVLNVQGDEPFIEPELLDEMIAEAARSDCDVITAVNPIHDIDDLFNPNIVKAVLSSDGRAIYFTRNPCPHVRGVERSHWINHASFYRHIGVYGYTREAIQFYLSQLPCVLEETESLEQLRFIDRGWQFQTIKTDYSPVGIDTMEDLQNARASLAGSVAPYEVSSHYEVARATVHAEIEELERVLVRNRCSIPVVVEMILSSTGKVVVTGLGKSGIVGHKISATLASTGTPSVFVNAAEALHGDLGSISPGDVVLMISNSATTEELIKMVPSLKKIGVRCIGMFGKTNTHLCRHVEAVLDIGVIREACPLNLAPMSSTTNTIVLGDAIASAIMKARGFKNTDFAVYHPGGTLGRRLLLTAADIMHSIESKIRPTSTIREAVADVTITNLGICCIVDQWGNLEGILTDGDFRRILVLEGTLDRSCAETMTRSPKVAHPNELVADLLNRMEEHKTYVLPVVDPDARRLLGVIRMHDVLT